MKDIEKKVSTFIENQFPAFYKEEGPKFIKFVSAYYEWLEEDGNALGEARRIPEYKDIDNTLEEFIIHFKEKYLRNIQFDTASNKVLLVKNALDLYRSKGTERSIDLFFKLVYGVPAEVRYPAEKILRTSDGIWERPLYLEISYSKFNIDYVNKQIVGAKSGATAFVEKYIRRKTAVGYVDLLYISNLTGSFANGEKLGVKVNNASVFEVKNSSLIGSIRQVIIQDGGINFKIGDIVNLVSTKRGVGGLARVASVNSATGVVDFILLESGYGYTLNADVLISEKVIALDEVTATSNTYFGTLEQVYQPLVNVAFSSATSDISIGSTLSKYKSGNVVASGIVVAVSQEGNTGIATLSHQFGTFTNTATYYTSGNVISLYANTVEDRTTSGQIMGTDTEYDIDVINQVGGLSIGEFISQSNTEALIARAQIKAITEKTVGSTLTVQDSIGAFQRIQTSSESNTTFDISDIKFNVGLHNINRNVLTFSYVSANNDNIAATDFIHQYSANGALRFKAKVITGTYTANTGNLTIIPVSGFYNSLQTIYSTGNTAKATLNQETGGVSGGDFINSPYTKLIGNTTFGNVISISSGSGANFNVGSIGDQETIFIGTDLLNSNNVGYVDYSSKRITVASNTGFAVGNYLTQKTNITSFNANTNLNTSTGFFTLTSANSMFIPGDVIRYEVAAGNTVINGFENGDYYYVVTSNTTGLTLSYPYRHKETINSTSFPGFGSGAVSQSGHSFYKEALGSVFNIIGNQLYVKDISNVFGLSGVTNTNISNFTVNSVASVITDNPSYIQANTNYMSLSLRSNAYGFPKNPQGDIKDTIYSCLSFGIFNIGSVGGLSQVDPGFNYNVDPFVLIYQQYIAPFNRNDFTITIANPTGSFIVGEKINQTSANLVYYDLQVASGVYGNTYNELSENILVNRDIDSTTDFIYVPDVVSTFNSNTSIANDFITITNNTISEGSYVRYYTATSNTVITGLSNNSFYYAVSANTSGFKLSATSGGAALTLTPASTPQTGQFIVSHNNPYANTTNLKYVVPFGNTVISGLANNGLYYAVSSNTVGFKVAATPGGSPINITAGGAETHTFSTVPGYLPGDRVYQNKLSSFNAATSVNSGSEFITIANNQFSNSDLVTYYTDTGNTVLSGLANNSQYYVTAANSTGLKLSETLNGNAINITAGINQTGHFIACQANATIQSVYITGSNNFVRIKDAVNTFGKGFNLRSFTYSNLSSNVSDISFVSITSTAKGLIKAGSNSTVLNVKRLTFENTFQEGTLVSGDSSSSNATIISVVENQFTLPIGLNANVSANVITANGQVASLQVIDSGYGYSNSELVQFVSADQSRAGSVKVVIDGSGIGKGYYKSSKGFLSADMKLHDGDYYQEYSYEVLSKISFEKYSEMFRKVMHMAGTKVFGSASITEEASVSSTVIGQSFSDIISFNALTDVSSSSDFIELDIEKFTRQINPINVGNSFISIAGNPFSVNDLLLYYTALGNTSITGMSNNGIYYVIESGNTGVKVSNTLGGNAITITQGAGEVGHYLVSYTNPFSNGDIVTYFTAAGNTIVSGLANDHTYIVTQTTPKGLKLANTSSNVVINITNSTNSEIGHYLRKTSEELLNVSN